MSNLAFNFDATYGITNGSAWLQQRRGLIDSLHRGNIITFDRYKKLISQDWDELEFPLAEAKEDFARYPEAGEMILNNVGWQWSGDSQAANSLIPMLAPFAPDSDTWLWVVKQGQNENLHALSYSEIVRLAVPGGKAAIERIHNDYETMTRVRFIAEVFDHVIRTGAKITLGMVDLASDEASDALMLALGAIFIFERVQFMASFANTAAIQYGQMFTPVCQTVRKIAFDEWNTHIPQCRYMLEQEMKVPQRAASMDRIRPMLRNLLEEVVSNEVAWNNRQFSISHKVTRGMAAKMSEDFIYYAATDSNDLMQLGANVPYVGANPLPFMTKWLDPNSEQQASMEAKGTNYLLNMFRQSGGNTTFSTDDIG